MEQRRLRLGDILDDYCPRERRVTNHAVVAMIEEDVRQTRCTTCDAEHAYKGGREPKRRKKDVTAGLYKEVLAGMPEVDAPPAAPPHLAAAAPVAPVDIDASEAANGGLGLLDADAPAPADEEVEEVPAVEEGPFHRRLIRATLPRTENQKPEWPTPEFTMRGPNAFRGDRSGARGQNANGNGNRPGRRTAGGQAAPARRGPANGSGRPGRAFGGANQPRGPAGPGQRGRKRSR